MGTSLQSGGMREPGGVTNSMKTVVIITCCVQGCRGDFRCSYNMHKQTWK
jgi:hypothetical protein